MSTLAGLVFAYLLGSLPTGFWVGRLVRGVDIRTQGSGNMGATNVFRVIGKGWGFTVLALDILKGLLAVTVLGGLFIPSAGGSEMLIGRLGLGFAAIAGHNWTVFLRFKGGKGVATTCGAFLGIVPGVVLLAVMVWIGVVCMTRYISLASIAAALSCPLWTGLLYRDSANFAVLLWVSGIVPVMILYTHRANIRRLRNGSEHKISWSKKSG